MEYIYRNGLANDHIMFYLDFKQHEFIFFLIAIDQANQYIEMVTNSAKTA